MYVCMYTSIYIGPICIFYLFSYREHYVLKNLFSTLLRFPECILPTIFTTVLIYIYICSFFVSGFGAGNISILCVLTLTHFLSVLYIFSSVLYIL